MLFSLQKAQAARQYWDMMLEQQSRNSRRLDRPTLAAAVRGTCPGLNGLLADLERDGVAVIPNYWSATQCAKTREELDEIILRYPACVQHRSNGSDLRLYGVEMAGPMSRQFHDDPFLRSFGEIAGGLELYNYVTLGARINATAMNSGSGDGWHRDAFGFQFKSILYLCDVTEENGPFEYICGSHKKWRVMMDTALERVPVPPDSRIDNARMDRLVARGTVKSRRFPAKAGTLILANTAGVHRGAPLLSGNRYALTNYYYHPYQIGRSMVENFLPLIPGVVDRLAPLLDNDDRMLAERRKTDTPNLQANEHAE